jgi:hypothetical protein
VADADAADGDGDGDALGAPAASLARLGERERARILAIERDTRLSEKLLRSMMTRADHLSAEQMLAMEGRQQLADEIALRKMQPAAADAAGEQVETADAE